MKFLTAILLSLIFIQEIYSQSYCEYKYDYVWLLGDADTDTIIDEYGGSEINFNSHPPVFVTNPKSVHSPFQNASLSSINGGLLLYSNGCVIFNAIDEIMLNGDSLNPGEAYDLNCPIEGYGGFQNMVGLPDLEYDSLFYLFYINQLINHDSGAIIVAQSKYAYASVISSSLDNGLGGVITKNIILLDDTSMMGSPVSAVKTSNALGWWIITPDRWGNAFHSFKLEDGELDYIGKQFIGMKPHYFAEAGQGKFSPDGRHFAWYHPKNGLYLYQFDRVTGLLYNFKFINLINSSFITGGCEFSPNSRFVYFNNAETLYQVDITVDNIEESLVHIADYDGFGDPLPTRFFFMERTPDNRIFMNVLNGSQYLHVIQNPNRKGLACNFEQHAIKLPTVNNFTFPHFPNYRLGPADEPLCDSFTVSTSDIPKDNFLDRVSIYPNPAMDYLEVHLSEVQQGISTTNTIVDLSGRIVQVSSGQTIDVSNISPGIYFLKISSDQGDLVQVIKFVKAD